MPRRHLSLHVTDEQAGRDLRAGFARIRDELGLPTAFPPDVLTAAEQAAARPDLPSQDATELPFLTIDPPGSTDLDQAMHLERRGNGYRVRYAIADVGAFVRPGSAIDVEAHRRGETLYSPDQRTPLHPPVLSEGAASLLPDEVRPALLWVLDLDADGEQTAVDVRRSLVRSRDRLDYAEVQQLVDTGRADERLQLLAEVGKLRMALEVERGGVSLPIPEQEVVENGHTFRLEYRVTQPVESVERADLADDRDGGRRPDAARRGRGPAHPAEGTERRAGAAAPGGSGAGGRAGRTGRRTPRWCTAWTRPTRGTPPCSRRRPRCCVVRATRRSTAACRSTRRTRRWRPSTRTRPPRCAGSSTATSARSASRCAPAPRCPAGRGRRCRRCPRRWATPTAGAHELERQCVALMEAAVLHGREGQEFDGVVVDLAEKGGGGTVQLRRPGGAGGLATATCRWASRSGCGWWRRTWPAVGAVHRWSEQR